MRILLIFILLLSSIASFSQEKYKPKVIIKELYVEFVDTIEYLHLRVDFDSLNKIDKVSVIKEPTTLKDTSKIEFYINKIKSLKIKKNISKRIPPTVFCYRLVNKEFENSKLSPEEAKLVTKYFINGTFTYRGNFSSVKTKREGNKQFAYEKDYVTEYDVEWYNEDRYVITLIKTNNPKLEDKIGVKYYVEIIKILNDKSYMFRSSHDGITFTEIFTKID